MPSLRPKLNASVLCPLSGTRFGKVSISPHALVLGVCAGDHGLYAACKTHGVRLFIDLPELVAHIRKHTKVVDPS